MAPGSGNGLGGQRLEGVPDVLGDRQAPDSHVEIPEGHLPETGQMTPRSAGHESGEKGRSTPRLDRAPGIRNVQTALGRGAKGRRARIQDTKPKEDRMATSRGEVAGGRTIHAEPEHRAWCSAHSDSWGLRSGPEENGARELSGLREGDPRAVRGSPRAPEQRAEDPIQGQDFQVRLWRGDGRIPLELPGQTDSSFKPQTYSTATRSPLPPPALLFVSQSGRNRLLLVAGRAGGCRLVNACFQPRLSQSACGSVFF